MRIAVLGSGAIGTLLGYHLAQAGHDVTMVARGERLAHLRSTGSLKARPAWSKKTGEVAITAAAQLDSDIAWDLVLVTVQRHQAEAVLPVVAASQASTVMFMFNSASDLQPFADAVGPGRFTWGFPAALASLEDNVLSYAVIPGIFRLLQITTVGSLPGQQPAAGVAIWRKAFAQAGLPTATSKDMPSWLKTHAAFMAPLMAAGLIQGPRAVTWNEARLVSAAISDGFARIRHSGGRVTPFNMAFVRWVPSPVVAAVIWASLRIKPVRWGMMAHVGHAHDEIALLFAELRALGLDSDQSPLARLDRLKGR